MLKNWWACSLTLSKAACHFDNEDSGAGHKMLNALLIFAASQLISPTQLFLLMLPCNGLPWYTFETADVLRLGLGYSHLVYMRHRAWQNPKIGPSDNRIRTNCALNCEFLDGTGNADL